MNSKVKDLWVCSLRDGSFKKGKFLMRDLDEHYDAVGVLCELAVSAGVIPPAKRYDKEGGQFFGYSYEDGKHTTATRAPKAVCEWAGIGYWTCNRIQTLNDKGWSFEKIADYIEENV